MNEWCCATLHQPRGPVYSSVVRANHQLAHRMTKTLKVSQQEAYGSLTPFLIKNNGYQGPPSERMVRQWHQEQPGYPENALSDGIISQHEIAPFLQRFLDGPAQSAGLGQVNQVTTSTSQWESAVEDAVTVGGIILGAIIVGKALHQLFRAPTLARPLGPGDRKRYGLRRG